MPEPSPESFNKRQVWELVAWDPAYERAALGVVSRFGEGYNISDEWEGIRVNELLPAVRGDRFDAVRFPAPGFYLVFVPHRSVFEEGEDTVYRRVTDPRFMFADSFVKFPMFQQRLCIFERNLRIMEELMEDFGLEMDMYPPTLSIPTRSFSSITTMEFEAVY